MNGEDMPQDTIQTEIQSECSNAAIHTEKLKDIAKAGCEKNPTKNMDGEVRAEIHPLGSDTTAGNVTPLSATTPKTH